MIRGRWSQSQLESVLISILIHLAVIFLVPYVQPAPTVDVFPLDFAGVIEISTVETQPAAPAPAPGMNVKEVSTTPKAEPPKPAPVESKDKPKTTIAAEPVAKPEPKVEVKPAPKPEPEPRPKEPVVDKPEVLTSPAGKSPAPDVIPGPPPEAVLPEPTPQPEPEPVPELAATPDSAQIAGAMGGTGEEPATAGDPEGTGVVPKPEYPGDDPTGSGMIRSTGGAGHGVVIPKGVQNVKGQGEAEIRILVTSEGKVDSVTFLTAPPDKAMERPIRKAVMEEWVFEPDTTPGGEDAYYLDVWIGYNGGTEDVSVKTEHVSYRR
ncbi:MAG: energy transducer TonB [Firmicutes bacterium]|nr:energy transducer TonB [Bacillota bacterium]